MAVENALAFLRSSKGENQLPAAILIAGPQIFLREYVLRILQAQLCQRKTEYRGFQVTGNDDFVAVIDEIHTPGLFSRERVIGCRVLRSYRERAAAADDAEFDGAGRSGVASIANVAELIRLPTRLVLIYEKDNAPAAVRRSFENSGLAINCARPYDTQLGQFAVLFAEKTGRSLTQAAKESLVARYGGDLAAMANAIEKASFTGRTQAPIDAGDIDAAGLARVVEVFELADRLAGDDPAAVIATIDRAIELGRDPFELLAVEIIPALRQMLTAATMLARHKRSEEIAQSFKASPYSPLVRRAIDGGRRFGVQALLNAFKRAAEFDAGFKMGFVKARQNALCRLILELAWERSSAR